MVVRRDVNLDVDTELAWELLTSPEELDAWLGAEVDLEVAAGSRGRIVEDDGTVRAVEVEHVHEGERIVWRWWPEDGPEGPASRVEITLRPDGDGTRVEVLEVPLPRPDGVASVSACTQRRWAGRLLDLEIVALSVSPLVRV